MYAIFKKPNTPSASHIHIDSKVYPTEDLAVAAAEKLMTQKGHEELYIYKAFKTVRRKPTPVEVLDYEPPVRSTPPSIENEKTGYRIKRTIPDTQRRVDDNDADD